MRDENRLYKLTLQIQTLRDTKDSHTNRYQKARTRAFEDIRDSNNKENKSTFLIFVHTLNAMCKKKCSVFWLRKSFVHSEQKPTVDWERKD